MSKKDLGERDHCTDEEQKIRDLIDDITTAPRLKRNLIHASGSVEEAENEIRHWFKKGELINYRLIHEHIFSDVWR